MKKILFCILISPPILMWAILGYTFLEFDDLPTWKPHKLYVFKTSSGASLYYKPTDNPFNDLAVLDRHFDERYRFPYQNAAEHAFFRCLDRISRLEQVLTKNQHISSSLAINWLNDESFNWFKLRRFHVKVKDTYTHLNALDRAIISLKEDEINARRADWVFWKNKVHKQKHTKPNSMSPPP